MISISAIEKKKQKNAYQVFFSNLMEKWGIKSPFKLDKETRSKFFEAVKEGWATEKAMKPVVVSSDSVENYVPETIDQRIRYAVARLLIGDISRYQYINIVGKMTKYNKIPRNITVDGYIVNLSRYFKREEITADEYNFLVTMLEPYRN